MRTVVVISESHSLAFPYWVVTTYCNTREQKQTTTWHLSESNAQSRGEVQVEAPLYSTRMPDGFNLKGSRVEIINLSREGGIFNCYYYSFNVFRKYQALSTLQDARQWATKLCDRVIEYLAMPPHPEWLQEMPRRNAPLAEIVKYKLKYGSLLNPPKS